MCGSTGTEPDPVRALPCLRVLAASKIPVPGKDQDWTSGTPSAPHFQPVQSQPHGLDGLGTLPKRSSGLNHLFQASARFSGLSPCLAPKCQLNVLSANEAFIPVRSRGINIQTVLAEPVGAKPGPKEIRELTRNSRNNSLWEWRRAEPLQGLCFPETVMWQVYMLETQT